MEFNQSLASRHSSNFLTMGRMALRQWGSKGQTALPEIPFPMDSAEVCFHMNYTR